MIFYFFVISDFVWSGLRKKNKHLDGWFFLSCCGLLLVGVVNVCAVLVFFFFLRGCFYYYFNELFVLF